MAEGLNSLLVSPESEPIADNSGEWLVAAVADMPDGARRIVQVGDHEIGVFRRGNQWYAYHNVCPHQGGPVCDGEIMPKVEAVVDTDGAVIGERFSDSVEHLICPWHGTEYRLDTGASSAVPNRRLTSYEVTLRNGDVYVCI